MIDIVQYRAQIGHFSKKTFRKKLLTCREFYYKSRENRKKLVKNIFFAIKATLKIMLVYSLFLYQHLHPHHLPGHGEHGQICEPKGCTTLCTTTTVLAWTLPCSYSCNLKLPEGGMYILVIDKERGNFWARYLHGNIRKDKGVHNLHFNIRSLKLKVGEVKNIVQAERPTIFGLSECELKRRN